MSPLYKHTMTLQCCHSTEQCTSAEYEQKNCINIQKLQLCSVIGVMGKQEQDRKESGAIVEWPYRLSLWQGHYWTLGTCTHTPTHNEHTQGDSSNSPTGSVCEHYVAFLICLFNKSHTCLFLPVTHGLLKHGPLSTWNTHILHTAFTHSLVCVFLFCTSSSPVESHTSEVSPYYIGNDSSRPYSLRSWCGRSGNTVFHDIPSLPTFHSLALGTCGSLGGVF